MPRITFKKSEHAPVDLHEAATVGRSEQHANVVVKDNRLSRAHCRFEPRDDGSWAIVDLDSQNGTFLNGRRVKEALVKPGDVVTIGTCDMVFEANTGPGASTVMAGVQSSRAAAADFSAVGEDKPAKPDSGKVDSTRTVVAPAALVLVEGSLADKIHPITHDVFTIGRKKDNHLCLEGDTKASGHHAHIKRDGLSYVLEDLKSMNGVTVNGRKITEPVSLKPGNRVVIGLQTFEFQLQGKPNVSSGVTAPRLAREDIQARLSAPGAAGDDDDLQELDAAAAAAPGAESAELSEHDRAALTQKVAKVSSGALFGVIEVIVILAIAGGVLYAAWMLMRDEGGTQAGVEGGFPAARAGGLLNVNPSFDEKDEGGFAKGWRYEIAGTDSFALVEGARGGQFAMQLSRYSPGNSVSYAVSAAIELAGAKGIKATAAAVNSEYAVERYGVAVLAIFWFEHPRDREPLMVTPVAFRSRMDKWTDLSGSHAAPQGARAFSVGVGIAGTSGSVAFDDVVAERDDAAPAWLKPVSLKLANGLTWHIGADGSLSLDGPGGQLLRGGRIGMHQVDGRADGLDVMGMLAGAPQVNTSDSRITGGFDYFDPLAERRVRLNLELAADGKSAVLVARQAATADGPLEGASRRMALHVLATPNFIPAELLRFEADTLMEYRHEIGGPGNRKTIGRLVAANTASGNSIAAVSGTTAAVVASRHPLGRELFLQNAQALALAFTPGEGEEELQQLVALIAAVQPGEDQVHRISRALEIFARFRYCQPELALAANAIDAAAKDYKLRLVELRDGINVPQLTRNESLYRGAMEQAIAISARLGAMRSEWENEALVVLREANASAMSPATRESAERARQALTQLVAVARDFVELGELARKNLFLLEIDIAQRDSEPFLVSARDFLASGQYTQGMLKLRTVVTNHPRCLRGTEAKERLVEVAARLIAESKSYAGQNLPNIATDRAMLARSQLNLCERQLLARILDDQQKGWLLAAKFGDGGSGREWLEREAALARRIAELRGTLPPNLPAPGDD
ncbi:MAG: FHA domain-containing protein [Planctomycetes bacterium]|nr:FHA domain-containing protein [Planctomycetota bacterium]